MAEVDAGKDPRAKAVQEGLKQEVGIGGSGMEAPERRKQFFGAAGTSEAVGGGEERFIDMDNEEESGSKNGRVRARWMGQEEEAYGRVLVTQEEQGGDVALFEKEEEKELAPYDVSRRVSETSLADSLVSWHAGDGRDLDVIESSVSSRESMQQEFSSSSVLPEDRSAIDTDFASCESELRANLTRHALALKEEGRLFRDKHDRGDIKGEMWAIDERLRIVTRSWPKEACSPKLMKEVEEEIMQWQSDAVLCCPYCFTTVCYDSIQHETESHRFLAQFVTRCHTQSTAVTEQEAMRWGWSAEEAVDIRRVVCRKCLTLLAFRDKDQMYHFFTALPSSA